MRRITASPFTTVEGVAEAPETWLHPYNGVVRLVYGPVESTPFPTYRAAAKATAEAGGTADGQGRVYSLLHEARPVLVDFADSARGVFAGWEGRVRYVEATHDGSWDLPVLGDVPAPSAVLIRPDGHVAWVGEVPDATLFDALTTWCGTGNGHGVVEPDTRRVSSGCTPDFERPTA